jgi:N-methylhydantoinase A
MDSIRVGVDIGGTFTDIVFMAPDGGLHTKKVLSSVDDYARAIAEGLVELFEETGLTGAQIDQIRHGTTVGSNAILEQKGAVTGLITTKGFRDVLEIRTLRMPRLYDLAWEKPKPLVERYLRIGVDERIDSNGEIEKALDPADAEAAVDTLLAQGVEAIAVCLLNSYANPTHELMLKDVIRRKAQEVSCCISFEVLPEIREYERTSTTVINAYVMPVVASYLRQLRKDLDRIEATAPLLLMQSNGGLMPAKVAEKQPCNIIESGPAAGVVGGQALAQKMSLPNIITFDMGGTTAKASLIEDGRFTRSLEYQVGAGIMTGSRLMTGGGYSLKVPAIDLAEVGAGGGSIVWIDAGGSLQIGPESAGSTPGPVCYDRGGTVSTITDANLILGYINPDHLVGGALKLNAASAREIFEAQIAGPLGLDPAHAAYAAHRIAAANMIRAINAVSSERGRDPRDYALFPFGGNGPLFAAGMASALDMKRIIVPPCPGVFSACGLLFSAVEHHYSRTLRRVLSDADPAEIEGIWDAMDLEAREQLRSGGFPETRIRTLRSAQLHYKGQSFELSVPVPDGHLDAAALEACSWSDRAFPRVRGFRTRSPCDPWIAREGRARAKPTSAPKLPGSKHRWSAARTSRARARAP